tara:strand:+ start:1994 stop:4993 length:3000 start_codon:yes stop_codon:yes gene_type:complete
MDINDIKFVENKLGLNDQIFKSWSEKCEIRKYKIGEIILNTNILSKSVLILLEGKIRLRGFSNKSDQKMFSLGVLDSIEVIGYSSNLMNKPIEIVSAGTDCTFLEVPLAEFTLFKNEVNKLSSTLIQSKIDLSELWFLLNNILKNVDYPDEPRELKKFLKSYQKHVLIYESYDKFKDSLPNNLSDYQWVNLNKSSKTKILYELIEEKDLNDFSDDINFERLIGMPIEFLDINYKSLKKTVKNFNENKQERNIDENQVLNKKEEFTSDEKYENVKHDYKFFSSQKGNIEETTACFQMLSHMMDVPIRKESVKKILEENINKKNNEISLDLCAAIAESLGLKTQLANIPVNLFQRSLTPLFLKDKTKKIVICFDVNKESAIIGDPLDEIKEIPIERFYEKFSDEDLLDVLIFTKTSKTPTKKFGLSWFKPAIKKHKKALTEVLVASIFVQIFQLMNPLIIQQIIDKVIGQNGFNTLPVLAVLLFSFSIFENVLTAVRTNLFIDTTNRIDLSLGEEIIDHLLRLPLTYFDKRPVGELSSRLAEMEQIRSFLTGTALTVLLDAIFSFIYIGIMLIYSWILTIVSLLVAPILASITFLVSPVIRKQLRRKAELNANTQNHLVEILTGIQTVKAQNIELNSRWRWRNRYTKYISEGYKNAITSTTSNSLTQFLNQVSSLSVLCVGAYLVLQGQLTLGELIAFRIISGYVTTPLLRLANLYQGFQQTAISIERIGDILNNVQESTKEDKLNIPLPPIKGKVSYEDLSFRFDKKGPLQLNQVSLDVKQGEFVAIVGQSGSGKSTLMKLLARLYDPDGGKILIDGYDISKVELYSLRRQIGIVPQDSLLFEGSVEENISLSLKESSSEDIIQAAKVACSHEFIMSLPVGYASKVGERGTNLSGGQRQRIAIARTVLQNPKLLIMDEATSALDYETERKVSLNLMEFFRGTTVFFITHRLNSITHADRIIMMHNGRIEEQGTHDELLDLKGRYFALFNQQKSSSEEIKL